MTNLEHEELLSANQARKELRKRPSLNTIYRWMNTGVHGGIKLESVRIGGRLFTSREACRRFILATSGVAEENEIRRASIRQARASLDRIGVKATTQ